MNRWTFIKILGISTALITTQPAFGYLNYCQKWNIPNFEGQAYFKSLVDKNLWSIKENELKALRKGTPLAGDEYQIVNRVIAKLEAQAKEGKTTYSAIFKSIENPVKLLNKETLDVLNDYNPLEFNDRRLNGVSLDLAKRILGSVENHPVVSELLAKYNQNKAEIGYCFGRATYESLLAIRIGLDEKATKKIWAVGPMSGGGLTWQFHVGPVVRTNNGDWVTTDTYMEEVTNVRQWADEVSSHSTDGEMRIFITDSNKFTPELGQYERRQMGLDISKNRDWYRGYFKDLMTWFQNMDDSKLATFLDMKKLPERPTPISTASLIQVAAEKEEAKKRAAIEALEAAKAKVENAYGIDLSISGGD